MNLVTPDSGLIFWMTLVFAIVFALLAKFGFPVITSMVDKRQAKIEGSLKDAEQAQEQLAHIRQMQDEMISQARQQQSQILSEAAEQRQALMEKSQTDARQQAQKILEDARKQIETEKENAQRQIRAQVGEVSVEIAEKILRKDLSRDGTQEEYLDGILKELDQK